MCRIRTIASLLLLAAVHVVAQDGSSTTQSLTLEVKPATLLTVSGNPSPLMITDAIAGADLISVADATTTYSLVTNLDNMKVVASIDRAMPSGTKLLISLSASHGTSAGEVDLSFATSPVMVVGNLARCYEKDQTIGYRFEAAATAGEVPDQFRTITLTLTE